MTTVVWFRRDLRLTDNPAFGDAAAAGPVLPVYILDETPAAREIGAASKWWLHHSLAALSDDLGGLVLRRGDAAAILPELCAASGASRVVWNRSYDRAEEARDRAVEAALARRGVRVAEFNATLLNEPWQVSTRDGGPFKVFTPFWKACLARPVDPPTARPRFATAPTEGRGDELDAWQLPPTRPDWAAGWSDLWRPGEAGARDRLEAFVAAHLMHYAEGRDRPAAAHVSRLSPHLHFGEISPRQVWSAVRSAVRNAPHLAVDADKFLAELGWREFAYHLLYHYPALPTRNWKPAFDAYPWRESAADLAAWQRGRTGYPLVDAGMRELWHTGYMHNRVRMVAASFLVKHLRLHWRHGEAWFWDTLVDADLANNAAGWQWVAGSGADAAPYFRVFNPVTQGRTYDPDGAYVRRWCPELAGLGNDRIHAPWQAPADALREAGVTLGEDYPRPIVDHAEARRAALAGFERVKAATAGQPPQA